jgi:hypothetical protein
MAEHGGSLTIFVSRIAPRNFQNAQNVPLTKPGTIRGRFVASLESCRARLRRQAAFAAAGNVPALQGRSFQQHAGDIVVLGSIADEEIEFGHEALEQFGWLESFSRFNRAQQSRLSVFFLASVFGLH